MSLLAVLHALNLSGCGSRAPAQGPGQVYYGSWTSYSVPPVPTEPIPLDEALRRDAYYIGTYDDKGHLVRFEKHLYGELDWVEELQYRADGVLEHRKVVKADGSVIEQRFDHRGRLER